MPHNGRNSRISRVDFDYDVQPTTDVIVCNLCGSGDSAHVASLDRYGYAAPSRKCGDCGLIFLSRVMTLPAYQKFYDCVYRPLVSAYHGRTIDAQTIQREQADYAQQLRSFVWPELDKDLGRFLDIGGSTGVVAATLLKHFSGQATLLDPAGAEVAVARSYGLAVRQEFLETAALEKETYDTVLLCQTIDHLLDIRLSLEKIHHTLRSDGLLYLDIVDTDVLLHAAPDIEDILKIDHPFYLTDSTMRRYLEATGFQVIKSNTLDDGFHVAYLAGKAANEQ